MSEALNNDNAEKLSIKHGGHLLTTAEQPTTLPEALHATAIVHRKSRDIIYLQSDGSELHRSYTQLWEDALSLMRGLRRAGLQPQDTVILQLADNEQFIPMFWGCQLAGLVPTPLAVPPTYIQPSSATYKIQDAWTLLDHPAVVTNHDMLPELLDWAKAQGLEQFQAFAIEDLFEHEGDSDWHHAQPEDLALLLLTSGSTGVPKAVMLKHRNILSMITGMIQMYSFSDQDVTFNWMPFDHVGGIVMMHLRDAYLGCLEINVANQAILLDPLQWLDGIDHYRATVTWAPNFAFGLITDYTDEIGSRRWDLSSMHSMFNGGEALVAKVGRRFLALLEPHGLPVDAIQPAWGMSETSSGVIFSHNFSRATIRDEDDFVEIGIPIPGLSIRIVDDDNQLLVEGATGRLQVNGPSVTSGYYNRPELNQSVFTDDGWFETGDLGFMRHGHLTITGRTKDTIIINGVNYYSHAIEAVVEELPEIETSYTAACAVRKDSDTTDQLAIFFVVAFPHEDRQLAQLLRKIRQRITQTVGVTPEYLLLVEKEDIPKTGIGKIQRAQLKQAFEKGEFAGLLKKLDHVSRGSGWATQEKQVANNVVKLTKADIQGYLIDFFVENLNIARDSIEPATDIHSLGVNSIMMMKLMRAFEKGHRIKITARELFKYPTIQLLATYLAEKSEKSTASPPQAAASTASTKREEHREKPASLSPLSEVQKGLWTLQKMSPEMSGYHLPLCLRFSSQLDIAKIQQAFHHVLEQHPILTSVIEEEKGIPYRKNRSPRSLTFSLEDISALAEPEILPYLRSKVKEPFILKQGPLMRVYIMSRSAEEHFLLVVIHHIIFDGSSSVTFMRSLLESYKHLLQGETLAEPPQATTYDDFVVWEQGMLASEEGERYRAYWQQQLSGPLPTLRLPADRPETANQMFTGRVYARSFSPELTERIKAFAQGQARNVSTVLLASYMLLLSRYSEQEEIIVGMPVMVRPEERFDTLIGYFLNMLPIRGRVLRTESFVTFLNTLQLTLLDGLDHAPYPFPRMVRALNMAHTPSAAPLFRAAFFYQNYLQSISYKEMFSQYKPLFSVDFVEGIHQEGEYELVFELLDEEDGMGLNIKYSADLFDDATVASMFDRYMRLVEAIMQNPALTLNEYSLMSEDEKNTLLHAWNDTQEDYPQLCFHELFEQQVHKTPDAKAVFYEHDFLTYRDLHAKSHLLALYLQEQGVGPDSLVGICTERSLDMSIGLIAILMAGGAYVPLDPEYPEERLSYMLEDSDVPIILTQSRLRKKFDTLAVKRAEVITLDQDWEKVASVAHGRQALKREVQLDHLAYVLYTSGSTGKPKGVMIPHRALTNFLVSMAQRPGLSAQDRLLAVTTYCFDIAGLELFLPLMMGAQCYICGSDKVKNAEKLKLEIQHIKPTIMQATPVTWTMLFQAGWKNEERVTILCGGEALPPKLKQHFVRTDSEAWNMFGPTETTIWSMLQRIQSDELITIGQPIANTQIYIVDSYLNPVPIGVPGELCIAGVGLARGYYRQPALTAEKFVENPFQAGSRLYKTGDLARWLPTGQIEYLGRIDTQVKLRGFRIELGAIDSRIAEHAGVQEVVTVVHQHQEQKKLVAYYTAHEPAPAVEALRAHVKAVLPDYMVPAHFLRLDTLPLTPNGKIDRKALEQRALALPRPEGRTRHVSHSQIEAILREIWREVLQVEEVGSDDGFFDVGGDSLLAVVVAERIANVLACPFGVTDLFAYPTIRASSAYLARQQEPVLPAMDESAITTVVNESPATRRALPDYYDTSVAVIGISCQFPGANSYREFWENLCAGKESLTFFRAEELREMGVPEELIANPHYVPVQSTIAGKDLFDPGFFHLSPKDAELMDPQLRLLLLHSWKAIEDAGYVSRQIPHTSVYMSASNNGYRALLPAETTQYFDSPDGYVSWVLAQSGTIPTMISHKLGLRGPSYFVHANCSSSLIGLHAAYQSLQAGASTYALVGASTIHTQSQVGYVHQPGLNFSSDGHIKAFDAAADGMAGGEGVAVIVLKNAVAAVNDGDHIYALLRGIGVNNDGAEKVGFYAPSVKGQTDVMQQVLAATQVDPATIHYLEAHGTGTKLGDPIELAALKAVYPSQHSGQPTCGLGSVKSNLGHLDTVAGLAGSIKVVLSLARNELVPSINYREPNPALELEHSPFYVVTERQAWKQGAEVQRAALSSFGLGGTNTHAIFEQYRPSEEARAVEEGGPYLLPLSARNSGRVRAYVQELLAFVQTAGWEEEGTLRDLAYTLQVGREAMESRVVFVAHDQEELSQQLAAFMAGKEEIAGCLRGDRQQGNDISWLEEDDDSQALIQTWMVKGKVHKLAELWCKGMTIDWRQLYPHDLPRRMSAPTYPFAQERYWPQTSQREQQPTPGTSLLHPLLHQNTSDLSEQRFSSTFSGQEFFLSDHVVRGKSVLPGVAYLEMVRVAVQRATRLQDAEDTSIRLNHVVWVQPIVVDKQPVQIHIGLFPEDKGKIAYEIYSDADNGTDPIVHGQGSAELISRAEVPAWNLLDLQAQCKQSVLSPARFYEEARERGIAFGPAFQCITQTYAGQGEVLTRLSLPAPLAAAQSTYVLHPSMMDAALQTATICIMMGLTQTKLLLPFALEGLEIFGACTSAMWAYARHSQGNKVGDAVQKIDVDLCDEAGAVCVRIKGFLDESSGRRGAPG
ncbi:hypothetical protein KDW_40970 [Dictyobacter vulcani]|uniref:Non-ribosomal peptide synthetase n=1 Tax=Dictyobacter vulcani TaxID=2607529 RepID=A0A5J4KQ05_9CHLR|nr:non-ribosomal peptide synthetase [Dictyobacter vulcani]GER89935.1 hypothetical protein KDW_40970 [Dictyobacter vulcani]